jgi:hypothetical protein
MLDNLNSHATTIFWNQKVKYSLPQNTFSRNVIHIFNFFEEYERNRQDKL